jgi:biofilm PGA synthesis N-glycosyltransferase PgaC
MSTGWSRGSDDAIPQMPHMAEQRAASRPPSTQERRTPPRSSGVNERVLIISPVRNEAAHIERVARSVAAQTLAPVAWVVVDDGSTDDTLARLHALAREIDVLEVHARPADTEPVVDRLAIAAAPRTFNYGLEMAGDVDFTHIVKLDGDIELPPDYFERLLERFDADPQLGMACGNLIEPRGGRMVLLPVPSTHVHGALKCYTRACWDAIGGVQARLGWDTIDETYARMRGFTTRNYLDIVAIHLRPHASADGTLRGRARHGQCAYIAHFGPVWIALRSLKIARSRPVGISGLAFFFGYARAWARGVEQVPDREFRRFARRELRLRMLRAVRSAPRAVAGRATPLRRSAAPGR